MRAYCYVWRLLSHGACGACGIASKQSGSNRLTEYVISPEDCIETDIMHLK